MQGNEFVIVMLLLWTFVGSRVNGKTVTGVLHGKVELGGPHGHRPNVTVEWTKYEHSTKRLICVFNVTNRSNPCKNISYNLENKSLILVNLTKNDEGIYEETALFHNGTVHRCNITLSVLFVSNITISASLRFLTLECETNGGYKHLQWLKNDRPLPDNQRVTKTEINKTMLVSSSDCGTYTCQISNEHGNSTAFTVNISDKIWSACLEKTALNKHILFPVGFLLICLLVLCIILIYLYKYKVCRKRNTSTPSTEEPVYNEPIFLQEESAAPTLDPLIVYQDFIKPKHFHQSEQSEEFGYSTIADAVETIQLPKIST